MFRAIQFRSEVVRTLDEATDAYPVIILTGGVLNDKPLSPLRRMVAGPCLRLLTRNFFANGIRTSRIPNGRCLDLDRRQSIVKPSTLPYPD